MTARDESPTAESVHRDLEALREELKERQVSLPGAIKTFVADYRAFKRGERAFPEAALLGVLFAYLRPRIVLVLGSVAAVILAGAQFWMLYRQNALIDQQNSLIEKQGYALTAQTTTLLLEGLDSEEPSATSLSLLSTFGDIGFESLLVLSRETSKPIGYVARQALVETVGKLSTKQAVHVVEAFLEANRKELANLERPEVLTDDDMRVPIVTTSRDLAFLLGTLKDKGFRLPVTERLPIMIGIVRAYATIYAQFDLRIEDNFGGGLQTRVGPPRWLTFEQLDAALTEFCNGTTDNTIGGAMKRIEAAEMAAYSPPMIAVAAVVQACSIDQTSDALILAEVLGPEAPIDDMRRLVSTMKKCERHHRIDIYFVSTGSREYWSARLIARAVRSWPFSAAIDSGHSQVASRAEAW